MRAVAEHVSTAPRQSPLRTAMAGLIGNVLEWFDFAVFGYFSSAIGKQFFPASDPAAQQVAAFAVFAIGFFARPAGSIILGAIGDRIGRRALLTLSIALMGGATLGIGILPTHAQIGVLAPVLLVLMRVVQGFSLGGEFTGSMVYTTELAPPVLRGLVSSSTAAGTTLGFILGSATSLLVSSLLTAEEVGAWGWRIPFIGSVVFVIAGWFLRKGIHESEQGQKAAAVRAPLGTSLLGDWLPIVRTFGIVGMTNAAYYLVFTFAVERRKALPDADGTSFQLVNTLTLFAVLFAKVLGGWMSDRLGRRRMMLALTVATMAAIYVALPIMLAGSPLEFMFGQILMALPLGMALGLQGAMLVEIFPLRTRVTSMSFGYSVTLALSGGVAPLAASWLIRETGNVMVPAYYVMVYGVIGLLLLWPMQETNTRSLDE
jgi:MHS family proline/betaine transporter-like MFS transporter